MMLVATLLICSLLLTLGLAFLSRRVEQIRSHYHSQDSQRALQIALGGLEAVRVKLDKDPKFPPVSEIGRLSFGYSEPFFDLDGVTRIGSYEVVLDGHYLRQPYRLLRVRVNGRLERVGQIWAQRTILAEFDLSQQLRSDPSQLNPRYFDMVNFQDLGSL